MFSPRYNVNGEKKKKENSNAIMEITSKGSAVACMTAVSPRLPGETSGLVIRSEERRLCGLAKGGTEI